MRNTQTLLQRAALLAALLLLPACDDHYYSEPPPLAAMDWVLIDGCNDGLGLQASLFDVTHDRVWPSPGQVYLADPGGAVDVRIACEAGALICYGAETDPPTDIYWGVGLDGVESCDDCCEPCDDVLVEWELVCGPGLRSATEKAVAAKPKAGVEK